VWAVADTSAPYAFSWNTAIYDNGVHEVQATAYDAAGNTSMHSRNFRVNN
jgi:hypothetical protein